MNKRHLIKKPKGKQRSAKSSGGRPSRPRDDNSVVSVAACDHSEERELLEGVYQQVFDFLCRKAELERQRTKLERECAALRNELRAAQVREEEEAKVRAFAERRAERRYQQLLMGLAEVADEYRLSVKQSVEFDVASSAEPTTSNHSEHRLQRLVQAPLERIEEMLTSQGISVRHAAPESVVDVRFFDVAGMIEDAERVPGTVVRTHRPAYVGHDGTIIRKGAAFVTRRGDPIPLDPQSAQA